MWHHKIGYFMVLITISIRIVDCKHSKTAIFTKLRIDFSPFEPTWDSLDKRPIPGWYDDSKFGIFLHWGVYSVPGFGSEWFWNFWKELNPNYVTFMKLHYAPGFTYQQFAPDFKAEFFNATRWAEIFKKANAKYVVLTSKHHEGFTMWPSKHAFSWNAKDVGPHRDIVQELSKAIRDKNIKFGLYYSLFEWYNPIYLQDKYNSFKTRHFVDEKVLPELKDLVNTYQPDLIWSDGDGEAYSDYWKSTDFLAWLYNESPIKDKVVVNDRWGIDAECRHGGFRTCADRYHPGKLQNHKWENCMTIDRYSWGYRRNAELSDFLTVYDIIKELVTTVSFGGNLLMNVGPTKDGMIAPIFQDRLEGIGKWLDINGESIFNTNPWIHQNDSLNDNVWYTSSKNHNDDGSTTVYAIVLKWPKNNKLIISDISSYVSKNNSKIVILGNENEPLRFNIKLGINLQIDFIDMSTVKSEMAWVLKVTNVKQN